MSVAFVLRCDGRREYIQQTVASMNEYIDPSTAFDYGIIIDDSGDPEYAKWLDEAFPFLECVHHPARQGLGACFKAALSAVATAGADFAFMVEDDTPLIGPVDLAAMAQVLDEQPNLAQIMLMRPPFNAAEIDAGGVYEMTPDEFTECSNGQHVWTEHSRWYGFQPHLVSLDVAQYMIAKAENFLELGVTEALKPAGYRFAYWGGMNDAPLCDHVGRIRSAGYRW